MPLPSRCSPPSARTHTSCHSPCSPRTSSTASAVSRSAAKRSFKPIYNRFAREWIEANLPDGVDGELMLRDGTFSEITSAIGRRDGQPDFVFHIFDYVFEERLDEPYRQRVADFDGLLGFSDSDPRSRHLVFVTPTLVRSLA